MAENVDIKLTTYNRTQFDKAINTDFTQFNGNNETPEKTAAETISTAGFFEAYDRLFLEIPKQGETNSHQYITNRSGEYVGGEDVSAEVQALTAEVTQLREENITLQQQIIQLTDTIDITTLT
tara:strand:- start:278 stop:646 length:369 start_codon:yes stop_codon:yes gene_type:complete